MQEGGTRGFSVKNREVSQRGSGSASLGCALGLDMSYGNSPLHWPFKYTQDRDFHVEAFSLSNPRGPHTEQQPATGRTEALCVREQLCRCVSYKEALVPLRCPTAEVNGQGRRLPLSENF